jgi:hypothetical protein
MNGIFGLSKREAEVFSFILKLDTEWRPISDKDFKDVLSTGNRRLIIKECNINKTNLSRFIIALRDKGLITTNQYGGSEIPEAIAIDLSNGIVEVTFTLELSENEGSGQNN